MLQLMGNESLTLAGLRLLVVDNNSDMRELLIFTFEKVGAEITAAATANEALEVLKWLKPNVFTSEIRLPNEDGYSLLSKIRELEKERGRQIVAIAVTADAREEDRARALASGFDWYLPKPVDLDELVTVVKYLVERDR